MGFIAAAIVLMVRGEAQRRGFALRIAAVACFAAAVVLNVLR